ncbi:unnamed protein product [Cylindrotheca closterium]|uniref:Uncharacterized protein n=1 Tax=Cylindrotheca closterium TaxID=2856 RepID=A0AAD2CM75_9STRA|nr:unnamed protein product [Cylindrotheca closterium]
MHTTLVALNAATNAHMDGLHCAMEDWFNLSTYLGFCLREWAQEDDYRRLASGGEIAPNGTKRAFTLDDIRLFDSGNCPVLIAAFIENFDAVARSNVKFSWQKNHDHGKENCFPAIPATLPVTLCRVSITSSADSPGLSVWIRPIFRLQCTKVPLVKRFSFTAKSLLPPFGPWPRRLTTLLIAICSDITNIHPTLFELGRR